MAAKKPKARATKPATQHAQKPKPPAPDFTNLIRNAEKQSEQDFRLVMLQSLTQTPHREIEPYVPLFRFIHDRDPLFFSRLAVWYLANGSVRDLKQLFVGILSTSSFAEDFREAGAAMLSSMAPFEVERVLGLIKGHKNDEGKYVPGLSKAVPRVVRTCVKDYLKSREKNQEQFDNVALIARKSLKSLYSSLRIKPGEYAQKILFDNNPPPTSRLYTLKLLSKSTDATEQARLIIENKIPYRVAVSSIKNMTGPVVVALINSMTPQEVINNLASLQQKGALENPDVKSLVDAKLQAAKTDKRVSALKTKEAIGAADLGADTVARLQSVQDTQLQAKGSITKPTALFIDKSGSLQQAIEVGKQLAALIAPICKAGLYVYAFDTMAYPIQTDGTGMSDWEKAFKGINASGGTACGAPLAAMQKRGLRVDQIIFVTDQGENENPRFFPTLQQYSQALGTEPNVIFINVGAHTTQMEVELKRLAPNLTVDSWKFTGDYYGLPSLIPMLAGGTKIEFLNEIMALELPKRKKIKELVKA